MNIFISRSGNPKVLGLAQALDTISNAAFWSHNEKPIFELIEQFNPKAFILTDEDLKNSHIPFVKHEHPEIKIVWLKEREDVVERDEIIKNVDLIISLSDNSDDLPYLINTRMHVGGQKRKEFESDILIFNDSLPNENPNLLSIINAIGNKYKLKVYGSKHMLTPYYLGALAAQEYKDALASAKTMLCFSKEWFFTCLANDLIPVLAGEVDIWDTFKKIENGDTKDIRAELAKIDWSDKTYVIYAERLLKELEV